MRSVRNIFKPLFLKLAFGWLFLFSTMQTTQGATATWIGPLVIAVHLGGSGNWNTAGNWSTGAVPGSGDDVIFNNILLGFTVTMTSAVTVKSITVNSLITILWPVTINNGGNALTVNNSLNVGAVAVLTPAAIAFTGSGLVTLKSAINVYPYSQLYFDTGSSAAISNATVTSYDNSTINNSGGVVSANTSTFTISGTSATLTNAGTFNLGTASIINLTGNTASVSNTGSFNLLSDGSGSASIGPIAANATGFSGQYNVQRYLQGGSTVSLGRWVYRNYRLMSSPVNTGATGAPYTINYIASSAIVTGAKSSSGTIGGNPTIYVYSEDYTPSNATFTSGNFKGVTDISNLTAPYNLAITSNGNKQLTAGNGFMFFFRGDNLHSVGTSPGKTIYPYVAPEAVTFVATGALNQRSYTVNNWQTSSGLLWTTVTTPAPGNTAAKGFNLVGNPYACTIDWETVNTGGITTTNVDPSIYFFNPQTNQYNTYSAGSHIGNPVSVTGKIVSGQGFFVSANNSGASLTFNETAKAATSQLTGGNLMMGTPDDKPVAQQILRLKLILDSLNYDDIAIGFKNGASEKFNPNEDTRYLSGIGAPEGISSLSADSIPLSINFLPLPGLTQQVTRLNVGATNSGTLTLQRTQLDTLPKIYQVWLVDSYKKDSLDLRANSTYVFDLDKNDTSSFGSNRFKVVVRQNSQYAVHLLNFTAVKATGGVQLGWRTENEESFTNFTVERSTDAGLSYKVLGGQASNAQQAYSFMDTNPGVTTDMYRVKIEDLNGAISYTNVITINGTNASSVVAANVNIYPNPASSTINLDIKSNITYVTPAQGIQNVNIVTTPTPATDTYAIKIINVMGNVVKSSTSTQPNWHDDVSTLSPGTYVVQVIANKDKSLVGKTTFVKL